MTWIVMLFCIVLLLCLVWVLPRLSAALKGRWQSYIDNPHRQLFGSVLYRGSSAEKSIALTFDDGPYEPYTSELLDLLDELGVRATFFVIGENAKRYPETIVRMIQDGHQIGNHTYTHQALVCRSYATIREEIERTDETLRAFGVTGEIPFRAPYVRKGFLLCLYLWLKKRTHVLIDFFPNPADWTGAAPERVVGSLIEQSKPGSIVILHDGNSRAAPMVSSYTRGFVEAMKRKGYRFVTVSELSS